MSVHDKPIRPAAQKFNQKILGLSQEHVERK